MLCLQNYYSPHPHVSLWLIPGFNAGHAFSGIKTIEPNPLIIPNRPTGVVLALLMSLTHTRTHIHTHRHTHTHGETHMERHRAHCRQQFCAVIPLSQIEGLRDCSHHTIGRRRTDMSDIFPWTQLPYFLTLFMRRHDVAMDTKKHMNESDACHLNGYGL